jgi:glucose-specific phosphotransferase system IIA component
VAAVASGQIIPLSEVHDEVFSQKMLGDGVAIVPSDDYIVAPCTGRITMLYPTLHAFGMQTADGLEILVHIGIDTVALNGKGFKAFASVNDNVEVGDKIIRIDSHFITNEGYDLTVMILFPNAEEYQLNILRDGYANRGSTIVMTYARKETAHI